MLFLLIGTTCSMCLLLLPLQLLDLVIQALSTAKSRTKARSMAVKRMVFREGVCLSRLSPSLLQILKTATARRSREQKGNSSLTSIRLLFWRLSRVPPISQLPSSRQVLLVPALLYALRRRSLHRLLLLLSTTRSMFSILPPTPVIKVGAGGFLGRSRTQGPVTRHTWTHSTRTSVMPSAPSPASSASTTAPQVATPAPAPVQSAQSEQPSSPASTTRAPSSAASSRGRRNKWTDKSSECSS